MRSERGDANHEAAYKATALACVLVSFVFAAEFLFLDWRDIDWEVINVSEGDASEEFRSKIQAQESAEPVVETDQMPQIPEGAMFYTVRKDPAPTKPLNDTSASQSEIADLKDQLKAKDGKLHYVHEQLEKLEVMLKERGLSLQMDGETKDDFKAIHEVLNNTKNEAKSMLARVTGEQVPQLAHVVVVHDTDDATIPRKIIDKDRNEYILAKKGDEGAQQIDTKLLQDFGVCLLSCAIGGCMAWYLKQPLILGYLLSGSVIGPGGLGLIREFVQIETLAQFGAIFLLFSIGVEFTIEKLSAIWKVALSTCAAQGILLMLTVWILSLIMDLSVGSCIFLGCALTLSSTTVVLKRLEELQENSTPHGRIIVGTLVLQDILLGLLLTLAPLAAEVSVTVILTIVAKFVLFVFIIYVVQRYIHRLFTSVAQVRELFALVSVSFCIALTLVTQGLFGSVEVGAFVAGMVISSSPNANPETVEQMLSVVAPVKHLFGVLFFSSVGMVVNPTFLLANAMVVGYCFVGVFAVKFSAAMLVMRLFHYGNDVSVKAGLGLAQVGEFAFVLASRGYELEILPFHIYKTVLGITAVHLLTTPYVIQHMHNAYAQALTKKAHASPAPSRRGPPSSPTQSGPRKPSFD